MPYIEQGRREAILEGSDSDGFTINCNEVNNVGELNYAITILCQEYVLRHGLCYASINDVMGVLSCAAPEFYRRVAVPYEDHKITDNGDAFLKRLTKG